jgi:phosphatidate cytidylyltransferase
MFTQIILLLGIYFLIGSIIIYTINRRITGSERERWIKFIVYFFIVYSIIFTQQFFQSYFYTMSIIIVLGGYFEIIRLRNNLILKRKFLLCSLSIYTLLSSLFIFFSYSQTSNHLLWLYTIVLTFDGFSQLSGQLFGKIKITYFISPNKTLEGLFGGFSLVLLTAFILKKWYEGYFSELEYWMLTLIVCLCAFLSDLLASYFKRKCNVKDYSNLIPGHGGFLDRFDSFIGASFGYILFEYVLKIL